MGKIFNNVIKFFKKLFIRGNDTKLLAETIFQDNVTNREFIDTVKIKEIVIDDTLLELQGELENNMITVDDLTEKQKEQLKQVYIQQLEQLDNKIANGNVDLKRLNSKLNLYYQKAMNYKQSVH